MKEWFVLKNKLKEIGVVSIDFDNNEFHIPDAIKFVDASNGEKLTLHNRNDKDYPYRVQFKKDGAIFFSVCDSEELEKLFP